MSSRILRGSLFVLAGGLLWCAPLDAGSVFLKNGYIIQGQVVKRDAQQVVLSWTNGNMTIYRRFIDEVILDPSEEMELKRAAASAVEPVAGGSSLEHDLDLPERLEDIIAIHSGPMVPDSDPAPADVTPQATPEEVPPPPAVPRETEFSEIEAVLDVPPEWHIDRDEASITIRKSADVAFPSLTVRYVDEELDLVMAQSVLREALESEFPGLRVTAERIEQIGLERALVLEGEFPKTNLFFSQVLVQHGDRFYLVGLQAPLPVNDEDLTAMRQALHSLRFSR